MSENVADKEKLRAFLKHENLIRLKEASFTTAAWDFNTALGNTIREKYESLYIKLVELTNVCIRKGAAGLFWVVTSPEIGSMFETVCGSAFDGNSDQIEMGKKDVYYLGTLNRRWRIYIDPDWQTNEMMVGANWEPDTNPRHVTRMTVCNFVI